MNSKIYYDDACYVCSLEINAIRERGEKCGIEFIDISDPDFKPDGNYYQTEMVGEFEGKETRGPETFRKMYEKLGFEKSVAVSRLPVVKPILDFVFPTWLIISWYSFCKLLVCSYIYLIFSNFCW